MIDPIWHKIAEAYEMVGKDTSRQFVVEMNGKRAIVTHLNGFVQIEIEEIPTEKPVLIQP